MASKSCARCGKPAINGYRYCSFCKSAVQNEMREANYLTPRPQRSSWRGPAATENRHETKFGAY